MRTALTLSLLALLLGGNPNGLRAEVTIAFNFVGAGGGNTMFHTNGLEIRDAISAMAGVTVTTRYLGAATYNDWSNYDVVVVYDLNTGNDTGANQTANYTNIANDFNGRTDQNLVLDGRIISSSGPFLANPNNVSGNTSEDAYIQNVINQMASRGGGLFLGTDHNTFTGGINQINQQIGVDDFIGNYFTLPLTATVNSDYRNRRLVRMRSASSTLHEAPIPCRSQSGNQFNRRFIAKEPDLCQADCLEHRNP
ncbi:MAG: hypothetical protein ABGZ37_10140 [Akkermansiaceae bacterium]